VRAVATVRQTPSAAAVAPLQRLGLRAQALRHLPVLLVTGTPAQLVRAVQDGVVHDVYPDEQQTWLSDSTVRSMRAERAHADGVTGKGVGIAVVDSGIDATHPDLADHVTHNVKLLSGSDAASAAAVDLGDPLVVPVDQGPYSNTDLTSGHGTAVAGVAAADAHTSPEQIGVAPDAHLIGYGAGDVLLISAALAAYDHILGHREAWGIDVVNNSYAGGTLPFDPDNPVNLATKAMHDAGLVVVFAAGNTAVEGSINPHSVAPWVISVGATDVERRRAAFSSGGLQVDNSVARAIDGRQQRVTGDGFGLYHPDVSAPGQDVVTSATPTGAWMNGSSPADPGAPPPRAVRASPLRTSPASLRCSCRPVRRSLPRRSSGC
jgi:serine protease AprX